MRNITAALVTLFASQAFSAGYILPPPNVYPEPGAVSPGIMLTMSGHIYGRMSVIDDRERTATFFLTTYKCSYEKDREKRELIAIDDHTGELYSGCYVALPGFSGVNAYFYDKSNRIVARVGAKLPGGRSVVQPYIMKIDDILKIAERFNKMRPVKAALANAALGKALDEVNAGRR